MMASTPLGGLGVLAVQPSAPSACPACSSPVTEAANALLCPDCFAHVPPYWRRRWERAETARRALSTVTKTADKIAVLKETEYCLEVFRIIAQRLAKQLQEQAR
jgi:predicted amidophosphoribosyltransferase